MNDCPPHAWTVCPFTRIYTGVKWRKIAKVWHCAKCGEFADRVTIDCCGWFCEPGEMAEVRRVETEAFDKAKAEWLAAQFVPDPAVIL